MDRIEEKRKGRTRSFRWGLVARNVDGFLGVGTRQSRMRLEIIDGGSAKVILNIVNCGNTGWAGRILNRNWNFLASGLVYELFSLSRHVGRLQQQQASASHSGWLCRDENELENDTRLTFSTLWFQARTCLSFRCCVGAGRNVRRWPVEVGMNVLEGPR